jgi:phosphate transport system permease protein
VNVDLARYNGRARTSTVWMVLSVAATALGLGMLVLILGSLLIKGFGSLSPAVFTQMTPPPGSSGGLLNAIVGSLLMTGLGVLIGAPLGIFAGTYLAEYGSNSRLASVVRFINDILLSAPSIVIGLFIYQIAVYPVGNFSGIAGALALAIIVVPVVLRTTEDMLRLVPTPLREAAFALGMPRSLVIRRVVYSAARAGMITGVLLAIARISGETAPLLFTALNNQFFSVDMTKPIANLPYVIFQFASSPYKESQSLAWAGAILITMTVLVLSVIARALSSRSSS